MKAINSYNSNRSSRRIQGKTSIGLVLLSLCILVALIGPYLSPYTYFETYLPHKNQPPSALHWFGTDDLGRDLCTRVLCGLRVSLCIGFASAGVDLIIGVAFGALSGFCSDKIDYFLMGIADILYGVPYLLIVILLTVIVGPGLLSIILAMGFIGWINMARIVRAEVKRLKDADFIIAAKSLGLAPLTVLNRHILPNIAGPIVVTAMLTIPSAIFAEAFLSFLGLGVPPPLASLGSMVADAISALRFYPWRIFFPAATISITICACHLIGDGLRDILDPHSRKKLVIMDWA